MKPENVLLHKLNFEDVGKQFNPDFYPFPGLFYVTFTNALNPGIFFVPKEKKSVLFICGPEQLDRIKEEPEQSEPIKPEPAFTPDFILELSRILTREKDHKNRFTNP